MIFPISANANAIRFKAIPIPVWSNPNPVLFPIDRVADRAGIYTVEK
jgi:hypothetical protein